MGYGNVSRPRESFIGMFHRLLWMHVRGLMANSLCRGQKQGTMLKLFV